MPLTAAAHALGIGPALDCPLVEEARSPVAVLTGPRAPVSEVSALPRVLRRAQHPAWRTTSTSMQEP